MDSGDIVLGVSDFVALLNQTLEYAYPSVVVVGELANFRVSKNRWVYFDLKDEHSSVKFFGTIYQLPGPLEDGLMLQVRGLPRLHPQYGFSVNIQFMQPVGEGSLKRAAALLEQQLAAEGLFDPTRKRQLPYPPRKVGLITSGESAAYHDFIKIMNERWSGVEILLADVQVQGEVAPGQIVQAIEYFNSHGDDVEVLVITRGGGSAEDLAAFSAESVTRAVAGSRIPTLVAIGHEVDISLAELAADQRASTPSNAAQLLVPDRRHVHEQLATAKSALSQAAHGYFEQARRDVRQTHIDMARALESQLQRLRAQTGLQAKLLEVLNPLNVLARGYALIRKNGQIIRGVHELKAGDTVEIEMKDGRLISIVQKG